MMKYVAPLEGRLRHLHRTIKTPPTKPTAMRHQHKATGDLTTGQALAERTAAVVGSWRFLIAQAVILGAWIIANSTGVFKFDSPPFILLNLLLSFQAGFTGPILLIAANVGALRDHAQYDRIEHLVAQNEQLTEQLAALVAAQQQQQQTPKPAPRRKAAS